MDKQSEAKSEPCNEQKLSINVMRRIELSEIKNWRLRMKIYAVLAIGAVFGFVPAFNHLKPILWKTAIPAYTKSIIEEGREYGTTVITTVERSPVPALIIIACLIIICALAIRQYRYCKSNADKFTRNFLARKSQTE